MTRLERTIVSLLFGLIIGALWQINIAVDALENDWGFAFPMRGILHDIVLHGLDVYIALDVWYTVIIVSAVGLVYLGSKD